MYTFTAPGVIVKYIDHMYYKKAYILTKYGYYSGYISSWISTRLDILTYVTCAWESKAPDSTGSWIDFIDPIHLSTSNIYNNNYDYTISEKNTSTIQYEPNARESIYQDASMIYHLKSSNASLVFLTANYIAQLCLCLPEHYADQHIWNSMLKSLIYLQASEWQHAWFTFEMSILDMQYNRFQYTAKQYKDLTHVNTSKIAQYTNKYAMKLRNKLYKAL